MKDCSKAKETNEDLAHISQAFPSRAGQESVKYESTQFLSGEGVLKHIEVDKNEQTRSMPAIGSRSRNKLEKCGLDADALLLVRSTENDGQCSESKRLVIELVESWIQSVPPSLDISENLNSYRSEGWALVNSLGKFDYVLLAIAESAWNYAITELATSSAYFHASVSQFELVTQWRGDVSNTTSQLMLESLEELFKHISDLSNSSLNSIGLVYLGWFLLLIIDLVEEKTSPTEFALATTRLTAHFNHRIVNLKSVLVRQSLPQLLTARAATFIPDFSPE